MASTGIGFRWLDILEKEFDTNFVDLDIYLGELESEDPDIVCNARQKMSALSSCFAQLTHKAQTIFQNNAKVEAELVNMRTELIEAKAKRDCLEQELHTVLLELHSTQLAKLPGNPTANRMSIPGLEPEIDRIRKKLQEEINKSPVHRSNSKSEEDLKLNSNLLELSQLRAENNQLYNENSGLRNTILALNSEVYGAKLAAKYLDKELAGRIQQLQLLGREMRGDVRDKLWRQLESEILLQRHKTVVRACRRNGSISNGSTCQKPDTSDMVPSSAGDTRIVTVKRKHGQGLGISITGGREHGVPILISELEPNGPAASSQQLYIGDAILSVNGIDLKQACHKEAVHVLQQQTGDCVLQVQYIAAEDSDENSLSEDGYNFQYRFFDQEVCDANDGINLHPLQQQSLHVGGAMANTPTAPRTPESNEQSRINSDDNLSCVPSPCKRDYPLDPNLDNPEINLTNNNRLLLASSASATENQDATSSQKNVYSNHGSDILIIETISEKNYSDSQNDNHQQETSETQRTNECQTQRINECQTQRTNECQTQRTNECQNPRTNENSYVANDNQSSETNESFQQTDNITASDVLIINKKNEDAKNSNIIFLENFNSSNLTDNFQKADLENTLDFLNENKNNEPTRGKIEADCEQKIDNRESDSSSLTNNNFDQHEIDTETFFQNNRTVIDIKEMSPTLKTKGDQEQTNLVSAINLNFSSNSLLYTESDNASSPIQTSTDNVLSSDVVSNNSESPIKNKFVVKNFKTELYEPKVYNDTLLELTKKDVTLTDSNYDNIILSATVDPDFISNELKLATDATPTEKNVVSLLEIRKFHEFCKNDDNKNYSSNSAESFSPKSGRSFNISCTNEGSYESSPVHKYFSNSNDSNRKVSRKSKTRKSTNNTHGVKTIQSIFRTNDYLSSDLSSVNSDEFATNSSSDRGLENLLPCVHSPVFKSSRKTKQLSKNAYKYDSFSPTNNAESDDDKWLKKVAKNAAHHLKFASNENIIKSKNNYESDFANKEDDESYETEQLLCSSIVEKLLADQNVKKSKLSAKNGSQKGGYDYQENSFSNEINKENSARNEKVAKLIDIDTPEKAVSPKKSSQTTESQQKLEFEQNIHAFLSETFSGKNTTEVQLPNLKILNGGEELKCDRFKSSMNLKLLASTRIGKVQRMLSSKNGVFDDSILDAPIDDLIQGNAKTSLQDSPVFTSSTRYVDQNIECDFPSTASSSSEGKKNDDEDIEIEMKKQNIYKNVEDFLNQKDKPSQYSKSEKLFLDEQKLFENKEKLLERYVWANQNKFLNMEGNGDPDFGTPV